jgi:hypothetical protein
VGHQIRYNGLITFRNPGPTSQSSDLLIQTVAA